MIERLLYLYRRGNSLEEISAEMQLPLSSIRYRITKEVAILIQRGASPEELIEQGVTEEIYSVALGRPECKKRMDLLETFAHN